MRGIGGIMCKQRILSLELLFEWLTVKVSARRPDTPLVLIDAKKGEPSALRRLNGLDEQGNDSVVGILVA